MVHQIEQPTNTTEILITFFSFYLHHMKLGINIHKAMSWWSESDVSTELDWATFHNLDFTPDMHYLLGIIGVLFDSSLNFDIRASKVVQSCFYNLTDIAPICSFHIFRDPNPSYMLSFPHVYITVIVS